LLIFNFIQINQKQQQKMKITLRKRKLKKGKTKLYLDIYKGYEKKNGKTNAIREYEYLVKYEPYEKGAAMYVSKYVCDTKTNWGIVNNNS